MKHHSKLLLVTLLLALILMLCSSCTEPIDYEYLVEEELIPTLEHIDEAYMSPDSYFETSYDDSIESALGVLGLYFDEDPDFTRIEAEDAFNAIRGYINFSRDLENDLLTYTKNEFVD